MPKIEDILIEPPIGQFDPNTDIQEMFDLPGTQAGGGDTLGLGSGEATIVFKIKWVKRRAFARWALGFSYAGSGTSYTLHREHPAYHPVHPQLSAATVHFSSFVPKRNEVSGSPANAPNFPAVVTSFRSIPKTCYFEECYASVRFVGERPWQFLDDLDILSGFARESDRYTYVTTQPVVELLQAEGGGQQLKWAETGAGGPTLDAVINNVQAERVSKVRILLKWMWVPEEHLSNDPFIFFPSKVFDCVGRVNNVPFLGRPAGTVLCDAPQFERFEWPVVTFEGYAYYGWNLTIPLTYFNPTLGVPEAGDPLLDNAKARGHRTLPWRANGKWYGAKRESGAFYLEETDLNKIFEHIAKP